MKETPPVFFWWGRIRIWQLQAMFNSKPEQFEYFFSASNGILYSFSDLKPSGFFDLPNIAGGNNFHQINRRNLLILPGGPPGLEGNGKPLSDTRFLSLLFLFILPPQLDPPLKWDFCASLFFRPFQFSSSNVYFLLINDAALSGNLQDNAKNPVASGQWNIAYGGAGMEMEIWK